MSEKTPDQEVNNKVNNQDVSWLKELGIQSWQAELAISGLVVTGLFQLPTFFIKFIEPYIIASNEIEVTFLKIATVYLLTGIEFLMVIFAIHLVLRGIWVALLGLNSAYPNGIDVTSKKGMGEEYWKKAKEEYPNLTVYNSELDKNCSVLFSVATLIIIGFSSFAFFIMLFYYLAQMVMSYSPWVKENIIYIGIAIYIIFFSIMMIIQYVGKKYPENIKVKNFVTNFGNVSNSIFTLYFLRKPFMYISTILTSNDNSKYGKYFAICIFVIMGFMGGKQIGSIDIANNFNSEKYFSFNNNPEQILNLNYENLIPDDTYVYTPIIQSDVINESLIKLFIPIIKREIENIPFKNYSFEEKFKMNNIQRQNIQNEKIKLYKDFNKIYLNGIEQSNLSFNYYNHPKAIEKGLMVYIPTDSCFVGKNILEIRKNYFSKDSVQKIVTIPFYISG